jgi:poly(3-hydroxybutyrate) depolymerase
MKGSFATMTESNVGPGMAFTMYRPAMLTQRHPVITWGNGTGTTPPTYRGLLELFASHGFIVIASNSMNVGQGTPPPMLDGVTWVLEQDMAAGSALFGKVDRERIGATGHSQGAFATSRAGADPRIKTIAPIESLGASRGFHGPVLAICGSMDTTVPCSGNLRSYMGISDQPTMYAESKAADHTNWMFSRGAPNPIWVVTNAWFRVHLMDDNALRPMFYGECSVCKDTATWVTMRQRMEN